MEKRMILSQKSVLAQRVAPMRPIHSDYTENQLCINKGNSVKSVDQKTKLTKILLQNDKAKPIIIIYS